MADLLVSGGVFVASLAVLLVASNLFTDAAERIGLAMGISPFIVGGTVVAGGTSLPELTSSVVAVQAGASSIVVGNMVGSNVANILLVLGTASVAGGALRVDRELMRVDLPLLSASAVFLAVTAWDGRFTWVEGLLALALLAVYTHFTLAEERRLMPVVEELVVEHTDLDAMPEKRPVGAVTAEATVGARTYLTIVVSLVSVLVAADWLVRSVLSLASGFGIGADLVAVTVVALGTSLPEIAVSVSAIGRGSTDIAVGNTLGSNVFNASAVMGVSSLVGPLSVPESVLAFPLPVMVLATLLYYLITQDREITRWEGVALLVLYAAFLVNLLS